MKDIPSLDWTKTNLALSQEVGTDPTTIGRWRKRLGKPKANKSPAFLKLEASPPLLFESLKQTADRVGVSIGSVLGFLRKKGIRKASRKEERAILVKLTQTNSVASPQWSDPKEIPCPDCYGGHFRPCQICSDSGIALFSQKIIP